MPKKRAFVKYNKSGTIIPGSLILTNGSYPKDGTYKEVPVDLCCPICPTLVCTKYRNDNPGVETIEGVLCGGTVFGDHEAQPGEILCVQFKTGSSATFTQLGDCGCD